MVKIKNVKRSAPSARPTAKRRAARARKGPSTAGLVIGILGWVCSLTAVVITIVDVKKCDAEFARIRTSLPGELAKLQDSVNVRKAEISEKKTVLTKSINEHIATQAELVPKVKSGERAVAELEPQAESLSRTEGKLREDVGAIKEDAGLTGEGVNDLKTRLQEAQKAQERLIDEYRKRYREMKAQFEEKRARPEPEWLRAFYGTHRHTPFGPAAGYLTGEKLFEKRRSDDARRYYQDVARRYPDSRYGKLALHRIQQIESKIPFEPHSPPVAFTPYRAPAFIREK